MVRLQTGRVRLQELDAHARPYSVGVGSKENTGVLVVVPLNPFQRDRRSTARLLCRHMISPRSWLSILAWQAGPIISHRRQYPKGHPHERCQLARLRVEEPTEANLGVALLAISRTRDLQHEVICSTAFYVDFK